MTMRVAEAMLARSRDRIEYARVVILIPDGEDAVVLDAILDTECMWPVGVAAASHGSRRVLYKLPLVMAQFSEQAEGNPRGCHACS